MSTTVGLLFLVLFLCYGVVMSVRSILIGKGAIKHPMYETEKKQKYILHQGIIGLIVSMVSGIFIVIVLLAIYV